MGMNRGRHACVQPGQSNDVRFRIGLAMHYVFDRHDFVEKPAKPTCGQARFHFFFQGARGYSEGYQTS